MHNKYQLDAIVLPISFSIWMVVCYEMPIDKIPMPCHNHHVDDIMLLNFDKCYNILPWFVAVRMMMVMQIDILVRLDLNNPRHIHDIHVLLLLRLVVSTKVPMNYTIFPILFDQLWNP